MFTDEENRVQRSEEYINTDVLQRSISSIENRLPLPREGNTENMKATHCQVRLVLTFFHKQLVSLSGGRRMFSFGDCPWCFSSATGQFFFFLKPDDGGHTHLVQPLLGNVFAFRLNVTPTTPFSKPKLSVGTLDLEYKHAVKIRSHSSTCAFNYATTFINPDKITKQHKCQHYLLIISEHKKIVNRINLASELGETVCCL